jgi:maleate isomerase
MADRLGYRLKLGIVVPSTNTTVQPETDSIRPPGVTNHIARIHIGDMPLTDDTQFSAMVEAIEPGLGPAIDRVMTCQPAHLVMAMSIPTFWGGKTGAHALKARMQARAGVGVTLGSLACIEALRCFEGVRRIGILTPYQPVGDAHVARFFEEHGYDVVRVHSLTRPSEVQIAHATGADICAGFRTLAEAGAQALVQVGTDLAAIDLAAEAERWLGLPTIAINAATYWAALRHCGIADPVAHHGRLLSDF